MQSAAADEESLGFFHRTQTRELVAFLGTTRRITIFVGAGASIDHQIPNWDDLIYSLLEERLQALPEMQDANDSSAAGAVARTVLQSNGPAVTASIVRRLFEARYNNAATRHLENRMFDFLYEAWEPTVSLATYVAKVALAYKLTGADVHIITTNFDDNIEASLEYDLNLAKLAAHGGVRFQPRIRPPRRNDRGTIPVVHIHGYLPRTGDPQGLLVLSERDYALWGENRDGPSSESLRSSISEYLSRRVARTTTLFVGSTLRDSNVVEALVRTAKAKEFPRIAVMPTQSEVALTAASGLEDWAVVARTTDARLQHLDVEVLRPDFFGQVSQLLNEVALSVGDPDAYDQVSYSQRLDGWWHQWNARVTARGATEFRRECGEALREVVNTLRSDNMLLLDRMKAELWVRTYPSARHLELWASSHLLWLGEEAVWRRVPIAQSSRYESVRAFASRHTNIGHLGTASHHWTHFMACPVILEDAQFLGLPVGVVSLIVDGPASGPLFPASTPIENSIEARLSAVGQRLLYPTLEDR